jgi:hypothetical protein
MTLNVHSGRLVQTQYGESNHFRPVHVLLSLLLDYIRSCLCGFIGGQGN